MSPAPKYSNEEEQDRRPQYVERGAARRNNNEPDNLENREEEEAVANADDGDRKMNTTPRQFIIPAPTCAEMAADNERSSSWYGHNDKQEDEITLEDSVPTFLSINMKVGNNSNEKTADKDSRRALEDDKNEKHNLQTRRIETILRNKNQRQATTAIETLTTDAVLVDGQNRLVDDLRHREHNPKWEKKNLLETLEAALLLSADTVTTTAESQPSAAMSFEHRRNYDERSRLRLAIARGYSRQERMFQRMTPTK